MILEYDLIGEYDVSLDSKGRFRIPGGLLKDLGNRDELEFVIARGYFNNLVMYPKPVWDKEVKTMEGQLNPFNPDHKRFKMLFTQGANKVAPDSADRVLLPKRLQSYPDGEKQLILHAQQDRIDIWTETNYNALAEGAPASPVADLAAKIFGGSTAADRQPF
ncbi:MAG: division/cell wall cluster transcriptional repressor MraZ [Bacteroidota bacterium]